MELKASCLFWEEWAEVRSDFCAILNSSYNFERRSPLLFFCHGIFILRALIGPSIDQFGRLWIFCQTTLSTHGLDSTNDKHGLFLGQFVSEYMTIPLAACASFCCPMFDGQRTSIGTIVICICRSPPSLTIPPNKKNWKGRDQVLLGTPRYYKISLNNAML